MATIKPTETDISFKGDGSALTVSWTPVTSADSFQLVKYPEHTVRSIQVEGTFGSATVVLNGCNDNANFHGLNSVNGSAISLTSAGLKNIFENCPYLQPAASGGDGTQSLTVTLFLVRPTPPRT